MKKILLAISCTALTALVSAQAPSLQWAKSLGGDITQEAVFSNSIAIDVSGNVYTAGVISNGTADLDPGPAENNVTFAVDGGMYVSKLDAAGNFLWAKQFGNGAATTSYPIALAVDAAGNVYTTGGFWGTGDFDPGASVFNLISMGAEDIFISKLDANGDFMWAKSIGGTYLDLGSAIALDAAGNVYTTGTYQYLVDFDPGVDTFRLPPNGCPSCVHYGAYVLNLDRDGNFIWAKQLGAGIGDASGNAITLDESGNIYTTGDFSWTSADFDPGSATFNLGDGTTNHKTFISKLDNSGNFIWAKGLFAVAAIGNPPYPRAIKVDGSGNVLTTGFFSETVDFDPGVDSFNLSPADVYRDVYISKLDASGNFVWAKRMGSAGSDDEANSLEIDAAGNIYTIGQYTGTVDFDPGVGTYNLTAPASHLDIFMSKLDTTGNFMWAIDIGRTLDPYNSKQQSIKVDTMGNVYATGGYFGTVDFDPGADTFNLYPAGAGDIFVLKLGSPTAGIKEPDVTNRMAIYPNPFNNQTSINFTEEQNNCIIKITDVMGKEIKTITFTGKQLIIEKGTMESGIYFVQIIDEKKNAVNKIIIQ